MGKISKYSIDRLEERNIELRFDCPYCGGSRIGLKFKNQEDFWNGVVCHKCKSRVILDSLNLTVLRAAAKGVGVGEAAPAESMSVSP